ncbi:hypothetical protein [Legionella cardiaca]|uniref:Protein kinase domain-containing protein n=1 Tax=Legionella cardiaca TaxID=1071983 RepID=A0ABY8AR59_9GAMM|nr:hypothetical protein [Legionella cardiaca]WED43175.1 hypothetical protein PXX05_14975 [Legionella cardiaca]
MVYCKKFISGINAINFSEESSQSLKHALFSFAYQALQHEQEVIRHQLKLMPNPEEIKDNEVARMQLKIYLDKQEEINRQIEKQLEDLKERASQESFDLGAKIVIDDNFIRDFAKNFRNIRHLSDVLSDAPDVIKKEQTRLYAEILFTLDQRGQESQLRTLSLNIESMIEQALQIYKEHTNSDSRNQAQKLVQMGIYEIIRLECEKATLTAHPSSYEQYRDFLLGLAASLPDVGDSTVIDNLSQYRSTITGKSIADLLTEVEDKFKIRPDDSWREQNKINAFSAKKALFHKLRFGQDDRREFAKRVQSNMVRDLFWGRNIRDTELFTKRGVSDKIFTGLVEQHFLKTTKYFTAPEHRWNEFPLAERRLATAIDAVRVKRANTFAIGDNTKVKGPDLEKMQAAVKKEFDDKFSMPTVTVNNGIIHIDFYYASISANELTKKILEAKGLGYEINSLLGSMRAKAHESALSFVTANSLQGKTLEDIKEQVKTLKIPTQIPDEKARQAYFSQLSKLEEAFKKEKLKATLESLELEPSDEILLRKLLELYSIAPIKTVTDSQAIIEAFSEIDTNNFNKALKIDGLEIAINNAYENLAHLASVPPHAITIAEKARILFSEERKEKKAALEKAFKADSAFKTKVQEISQIFLDEYLSAGIVATLGLVKEDEARLKHDIEEMATEVVRLLSRSQEAAPALEPQEEADYFSAIQQIAGALDGLNLKMNEVQFKIPHSWQPPQKIMVLDNKGHKYEVSIELKGAKLPYSLIKPPGDSEFIFSYGGTRGILAPFAGLDQAYAGKDNLKRRLFTHSRLLGIGQYGAVKEVEDFLSGLNRVVKKGYVKSPFKDTSVDNLRTLQIYARTDRQYRIENDILQTLSKALKTAQSATTWLEQDKERYEGILYAEDTIPLQYKTLTERAKGETFADAANKILGDYDKTKAAYHNPTKRKEKDWSGLTDMLALAQALTEEAAKLEELGFSHNDIKPENFLFKQNADGSYQIKYIDWATGGFKQQYTGDKRDLQEVFAEVFVGSAHDLKFEDGVYYGADGRFVKEERGQIIYGVNPNLEILHGNRNGTLPYILPEVLGPDRKKKSQPAKVTNKDLDTIFQNNDPRMDDWALTSMAFGICNRQAYFAIVKGRAIAHYVIPGVIEADGQIPLGLKIVNPQRFNELFACGSEIKEKELLTGASYDDPSAVMYIPSNQREGEPLHLYRRLQELKQTLEETAKGSKEGPEHQLIGEIDRILTRVHEAIAKGTGLSKRELMEQLHAAQKCLKDYQKLSDSKYLDTLAKRDALHLILNERFVKGTKFSANDLLKEASERLSRLEILATYPATADEQGKVIQIFSEAINEDALHDKFLRKGAPARELLRKCIAHNQQDILVHLISNITDHTSEIEQLKKQLDLLPKEMEELRLHLSEKELHFQEQQKKHDGLKRSFDELKEERTRLENVLSKAEQVNKETRERLEENLRLNQITYNKQEIELAELSEKLKHLGEEKHSLQQKLDILEEANKQLKQKKDYLTAKNEDFIELVRAEGLLHYAAQQGMTTVFTNLITALQKAGATSADIFKLTLMTYGPELVKSPEEQTAENTRNLSYIQWSTNCLHIAIRNDNSEQLKAILSLLPAGKTYDAAIHQALHLCAVLGNKHLFREIVKQYNSLNLTNELTAEKIMALTLPPEELSPLHLFLRDRGTLDIIEDYRSAFEKNAALARQLLAIPPQEKLINSALIAAENRNFAAISRLIHLGETISPSLSPTEWQQFYTQTDIHGKNILNHILEQGQLSYLTHFIKSIKKNGKENSAAILVQLLSNPHPANPLKNFLNKEISVAQKFQIVTELLDAICTNFADATEKEQQARVVALLVNKEWLIEQAKHGANEPPLRLLLQNDALSIPFKQILFKTLQEGSQPFAGAAEFYNTLLSEVSLQVQELSQIKRLQVPIFKEVAKINTDLSALLRALGGEKELAEEFEEEKKRLIAEVKKYKQQWSEAEEEAKKQKAAVERVKEELESTKAKLSNAERESSKLREEMKEKTEGYESQIEELKKAVVEATRTGEDAVREAQELLRQAQEKHKKEMDLLAERLNSLTKETEDLRSQLKGKTSALQEQVEKYDGLKRSFDELEKERARLEKALSEAKTVDEETRKKLEEELRRTQEAYKAQEIELAQLSEKLKHLGEEKDSLQQKLNVLEETNKQLQQEKDNLTVEVKKYKQQLSEVEEEAKKQKVEIEQVTKDLEFTKDKLASAEEESNKLRKEIKEKSTAYESQIEELKKAVVEATRTGEDAVREAQELLRQAQEKHKKEMDLLAERLNSLTKETEDLRSQLKGKTSALQEQVEKYDGLKRSFDELEKERVRLEKALSEATVDEAARKKLEEELRQVQESYNKQEIELAQLSEKLKHLGEEKDSLQQKLNVLEETNKQLQQEKDNLTVEVKKYKQQLSEVEEEAKKQKVEIEQVTKDLEFTKDKLASAEEESNKLRKEIKEKSTAYESQIEELKKAVVEATRTGEDAVREAQELLRQAQEKHKKEMDLLAERLNSLTKETEDLRSQLKGKTSALQEQVEKYDGLKRSFDELEKERVRLEKALSEATVDEAARKKLEEELRQVQESYNKQEIELAQLSEKLKHLGEEKDSLQQKLNVLEETNKQLQQEKDNLTAEVKKYKQQWSEAEEEAKKQKAAVERVKEELESTKVKLSNAERESSKLREEMKEKTEGYESQIEELKKAVVEATRTGEDAVREAQELLRQAQEKHKKEMDLLAERLNSLTKETEDLRSQLKGKTSALQEQVEKYDELKRSFDELEKERARLEKALSEAKTVDEETRKKLEEELRRTQEAYKAQEIELAQLSEKLKHLGEEKDSLQQKLNVLEETNKQLQQEKDNLTAEVKKYKQQWSETEEELKKERAKTQEANKKAEAAEKTAESAVSEAEEMRMEMQRMKEEMTRLREEMALREQKVKEREDTVAASEDKVRKREEDAAKKEKDLNEREETVAEREKNLERATETVAEKAKDLEKREESVTERERNVKEREATVTKREKEVTENEEKLRQRSEELKRQEEELQRRAKDLDKRGEELQRRAEDLDQQEEELQRRAEDLDQQEEELQRRAEDMDQQEEELQRRTEDLEQQEEELQRRGADIPPLEEAHRIAQRNAMSSLRAQISKTKDYVLLEAVRVATNNDDLINAGLSPRLVAALFDTDYILLADAAANRLTALREEQVQRKAIVSSAIYEQALNKDKEELRTLTKNLPHITSIDKDIQDELKYLAKASPVHWFNPGFQAAAKKHANEMAPHFEKLGDGCSIIVGYLKPLSHELRHQLKCLPAPSEMVRLAAPQKKAIEDQRAVLTRYLRAVEKELALYEPLYKRLYGDHRASHPLLKQGILKTLNQARSDKHSLRFLSFSSDFSDHPLSEKAEHLEADYESAINAPRIEISGTTGVTHYKSVSRAKVGYFREHVINPNSNYAGYFMEEHASNHADAAGDFIEEHPDVLLTLSKFPDGPDPNDPELITARVQFSLAMATQLLSGFSEPPTAKKPVTVSGEDPVPLRYLWTALVLIGREVPNFKFDHTAVEIFSSSYRPTKELEEIAGLFGFVTKYQFTPDSCYETCFKNQPSLTQWLAGIKEATNYKLGFEKERGQMKKMTERVTYSFFGNSKTKDVLEEIRQENEIKGPECDG